MRLAILLLLIPNLIFAQQSKKKVLNQIESYKDSLLIVSSYGTQVETLNVAITEWLLGHGWKQSEKDTTIFLRQIVNRERTDAKHFHSKAPLGYAYCKRTVKLELTVLQIDRFADFEITTTYKEPFDSSGNGCPPRPAVPVRTFEELTLRRFLYEKFISAEVDFSDKLERAIAEYNSGQSEKNKLIKGRDY